MNNHGFCTRAFTSRAKRRHYAIRELSPCYKGTVTLISLHSDMLLAHYSQSISRYTVIFPIITAPHLSPEWSEAIEVKCLAQEHNTLGGSRTWTHNLKIVSMCQFSSACTAWALSVSVFTKNAFPSTCPSSIVRWKLLSWKENKSPEPYGHTRIHVPRQPHLLQVDLSFLRRQLLRRQVHPVDKLQTEQTLGVEDQKWRCVEGALPGRPGGHDPDGTGP